MEEEYSPEILSVLDDEGKEIEFEKLDEYEDEVTGKTYFALTEYPEPEEGGELIILISEENDEGEFLLIPIEDQNEYDSIGIIFQERLKDLFEEQPDDEE